MEWSVSDDNSRYKVTLEEGEGEVRASSMTKDGSEIPPPRVVVSDAGKLGRLLVESDGNHGFAHVVRFGDEWWVHIDGRTHVLKFHEQGGSGSAASEGSLAAPMPGTILELMVKEGQRVREGQPLMVLEAMKMEHRILAPRAGEVTKVNYEQGDRVDMGSVLVEISE
tara:strand:- start:24115 stop:24615 length:501 start_codon:yes stop_codon:yes gene_type:complete